MRAAFGFGVLPLCGLCASVSEIPVCVSQIRGSQE